MSARRKMDEAVIAHRHPRARTAPIHADPHRGAGRRRARDRRRPPLRLGGARPRLCRGRALDGFWEFGLQPWDIAAGLLLVREAGGYVSDLSGGHAMMASGDILAANDHLHLPLAAMIRDAMRGDAAA